jgi:hypothetical protein
MSDPLYSLQFAFFVKSQDTVRFGAARLGGRWEIKFLRRSRHYTTCLGEVLRVA